MLDDLQNQRDLSRRWGEETLTNCGFYRSGSSSLFTNNQRIAILSPGISAGRNGKYWFDIRESNLMKLEFKQQKFVLLRIRPRWFGWLTLESLGPLMTARTKDQRKNSGVVWGFYCSIQEERMLLHITSNKDQEVFIQTNLLDRPTTDQILAEMVRGDT